MPSNNSFLWFGFLVFASGMFLLAGPDQVITGLVTGNTLSFNDHCASGSSDQDCDKPATTTVITPDSTSTTTTHSSSSSGTTVSTGTTAHSSTSAPQTNAADLSLYNFNKYPIQIQSVAGAERDFESFINKNTVVAGSNGVLISGHQVPSATLYSQIVLEGKNVKVITGCPEHTDHATEVTAPPSDAASTGSQSVTITGSGNTVTVSSSPVKAGTVSITYVKNGATFCSPESVKLLKGTQSIQVADGATQSVSLTQGTYTIQCGAGHTTVGSLSVTAADSTTPAASGGKMEACAAQKIRTNALLKTFIDETAGFAALKDCKASAGNSENKVCFVCGEGATPVCPKVAAGTGSPGGSPQPGLQAGSAAETKLKANGFAGVAACGPTAFKIAPTAGAFTGKAETDKIWFTALLKKVDANQKLSSAVQPPALKDASVFLTIALIPIKAGGSYSTGSGTPLYAKFCNKKNAFGALDTADNKADNCVFPQALTTQTAGQYALTLKELGISVEFKDGEKTVEAAKATSLRFSGKSIKGFVGTDGNDAAFRVARGEKVKVKVFLRQWFTDSTGSLGSGKLYCSTRLAQDGGSVGEEATYTIPANLVEVKTPPAPETKVPAKKPDASDERASRVRP